MALRLEPVVVLSLPVSLLGDRVERGGEGRVWVVGAGVR